MHDVTLPDRLDLNPHTKHPNEKLFNAHHAAHKHEQGIHCWMLDGDGNGRTISGVPTGIEMIAALHGALPLRSVKLRVLR